jgi:hypothetical protein
MAYPDEFYSEGWLKISTEELQALDKLGDDYVAFNDGSGHLVMMDLFHQLHCVSDALPVYTIIMTYANSRPA